MAMREEHKSRPRAAGGRRGEGGREGESSEVKTASWGGKREMH